MSTRPAFALALALLTLSLASCTSQKTVSESPIRPAVAFDPPMPEFPDLRLGRMPQWYQDMAEGGEIVIDNPHGSVYVRYNRGGRRVGISATVQRLGPNPQIEELRLYARPELVRFEVSYPEAGRDDANLPYGRPGRVDLAVLVPEGIPLRVRTRDGAVTGKRLRSRLDIETGSGDISFSGSDSVRARSVSGNISVALSSAKWSGTTDLHTEQGAIRLEFPVSAPASIDIASSGRLLAEPEVLAKALHARPGGWTGTWRDPGPGQHRLLLRNGSGDVTLLVYGLANEFEQLD